MQKVKIASWKELPQRKPIGALVEGVDLVIVRWDDNVSVLYGRCQLFTFGWRQDKEGTPDSRQGR